MHSEQNECSYFQNGIKCCFDTLIRKEKKFHDNYNCFLHLKLKDFLDNERIYSLGELTDVLAGKEALNAM